MPPSDEALIAEAAFLADAAYADDSAPAREGGWRPLTAAELGPVADLRDGVQVAAVGDAGFTSAAHAYVGEVEGETVVALAFRGTDEDTDELLHQIGRWDEYYAAHEDLVDAVEAHVAEGLEDGSVDGLLVTGHSLGAIIAETAAAGLDEGDVRDATDVVTFGSPGSPAEAPDDVRVLNVLHSDDAIAAIRDLADDLPPLADLFLPEGFAEAVGELAREGEDLVADRPEGRPFGDGDAEVLLDIVLEGRDWAESEILVEHELDLYLDTAGRLLEEGIA
jgi:Lipase (class 3)